MYYYAIRELILRMVLLLSTVTGYRLPVEIAWTGSQDLIYFIGKND